MKFAVLFCLLNLVATNAVFAEKVLRYSEDGAPTTLDPVAAATGYTNKVVENIYDTFYAYKYLKVPFELKPRLATGMPKVSKDGLTYTFEIKKGVKFTDDPAFKDGKGREVTVEDFIYSMKRHFDPKQRSEGAWLWLGKIVGLDDWKTKGSDYKKDVEGLKALDPYTLEIKLTKPFPQLLYTLTMGFSAFVPKEVVEKYGREFSVHPVGSGPFKLQSHNTKKTVLVRNPGYRKDVFDIAYEGYDEKIHGKSGIKELNGKTLPIVDKVELHWMEQPIAHWNSFRKGNEIAWTVLQNEQIDEVLSSKNPVKLKPEFEKLYHYRVAVEAGHVYMNFNQDDPDLGFSKDPKQNAKNKALRCAIRKGWDWRQRIDRYYLGLGDPFAGFIPPGIDGFDPNLAPESVKLDVSGAKKLLADNGFTPANLPKLRYDHTANVRDRQFYEQFRGWLQAIGYPKEKVTSKEYATFGDFNKAVKERKAQFIAMAWGLDYPDAENTLGMFYGPNQSPGSNTANYDNPEYNKLFVQAVQMQPSPQRTELYKKLNMMIVDDCATVSGFSRTRVFLWHKNTMFWPQRDMMNHDIVYADVK